MAGVDSGARLTNALVIFMTLLRVQARSAPNGELPDDLYIGFVDSLLVLSLIHI